MVATGVGAGDAGGLLLQPRMVAVARSAIAGRSALLRLNWEFANMKENLPLGVFLWNGFVVGLPSVEEGGDGLLAGVFELLFVFGVEEIAVGVDDGKSGNAFGDGDVVLLGDVDVVIHVADVDVDEDEVLVRAVRRWGVCW